MNMKEEVKKLWRLCFADSEAFIEMYFRLRYSDDINMAIRRDGRVISALQMIPYPITFPQAQIQASYISGACTHPDFRGKGVMGQLLSDAFAQMVQRNIPLSFLIPAEPGLYNYYARFGYAPAFFRTQITQHLPAVTASTGYLRFTHSTTFSNEAFDYFTRKASSCTNYVQHTESDFNAILEDLAIGHGSVLIVYKENKVAGILFAYPQEDALKISQLFAEDKEIEEALIDEATHYYQQQRFIRFKQPTRAAEEVPFGMARIIDAQDILQRYAAAYPKEELCIALTDEQLPTNNGYYHIAKGHCVYSNQELEDKNYTALTSQQLSARIFDNARLYMSLMLD